MRFKKNLPVSLSLVVGLLAPLPAEIPLPDATVYGQLKTPSGAPVNTGTLRARIQRGAAVVIEVTGEFKAAEGADWYVIRIPLETNIGAPGPSGLAAREGDSLAALLLNGKPIEPSAPLGTLAAGSVRRIDGTSDAAGPVYIRGDCSPDRVINITDPVRLLSYLFVTPGAPPCLEACDADGSGVLNITDAVFTLGYLFLGGQPLPPPGPACGTDPSPSSLGCVTSSCV
jgi:hypothetical protein